MGMILIAPKLMGISFLEAAVLGAVLAAVYTAVVVPMLVDEERLVHFCTA